MPASRLIMALGVTLLICGMGLWMNALASAETVKGDFSDTAQLDYRGGRAEFRRDQAGDRMRLTRGPVRRGYSVTRTIGSRFFQYYVGRLVEDDAPPDRFSRGPCQG